MAVVDCCWLIGSVGAAPLAGASIVDAQGDWPKGPIKIVVPFPPGGSTDPVARIIQAKLIETTGWNIIVDNKQEYEKLCAYYPVGTRQRLAYDLILFSGVRGSDLHMIRPQHLRSGWLPCTD